MRIVVTDGSGSPSGAGLQLPLGLHLPLGLGANVVITMSYEVRMAAEELRAVVSDPSAQMILKPI
jgi:hypothetical protein